MSKVGRAMQTLPAALATGVRGAIAMVRARKIEVLGAVDCGMIGALIGFGVDSGLAIVGVLSYRFFAFWLPIIPGVIAYLQLLRTEPANRSSRSSGTPMYAQGKPGGQSSS
jgi:hypothetical protein